MRSYGACTRPRDVLIKLLLYWNCAAFILVCLKKWNGVFVFIILYFESHSSEVDVHCGYLHRAAFNLLSEVWLTEYLRKHGAPDGVQDPLEKPRKELVQRSVLLQAMSDVPGLQALCCCPRLQWKRVWDCFAVWFVFLLFFSFFFSFFFPTPPPPRATSPILMNKQWFPHVNHCISRKRNSLYFTLLEVSHLSLKVQKGMHCTHFSICKIC